MVHMLLSGMLNISDPSANCSNVCYFDNLKLESIVFIGNMDNINNRCIEVNACDGTINQCNMDNYYNLQY